MKKNLNDKGFTLIELLVSAAIIAVLAGISISEYSSYRQKTNDLVAFHQLLSIRKAMEASDSEALDLNNISGLECTFCLLYTSDAADE